MADPKNMQFREAETRYTLLKLNAGSSVSLVGVGSVGKSNFLRHILHRDIESAYLGPEAEGLHLVYIDPNNMLDALPPVAGTTNPNSWAGYEIMTHRLYRYFQPRFESMPEHVGRDLFQVYQNLQDGGNPLTPHVALRNFEYAVDLIIRQGLRLVFVFDEFEVMLAEMPTKFFRTLRGLRDDYKYQLMYLSVTRKALPDLIVENKYDYDELEPFIELFSDTTRFIGAYSSRDALDVMKQMIDRQGTALNARAQDLIIKVSGGHAGLMRAAYSLAYELPDTADEAEVAERLARYRAIQAESHTIWLSLNGAEQAALYNLMGNKPNAIDPRATETRMLTEKQLLGKAGDTYVVTPPLFRAYLKTQVR